MKCPHCTVAIVDAFSIVQIYSDSGVTDRNRNLVAQSMLWQAQFQRCPGCHRAIVFLHQAIPAKYTFLAYPHGRVRPVAAEVPELYRKDFLEAVAVLPHSPKASAAL